MEPLSIGLIAAAVLIGLGTATWAALKGWTGWLELKRLELCRDGADRSAAAGRRADRDRRPQGAGPQARGDRRRNRYLRAPPEAPLPGVSLQRGGPAPPVAGPPFSFVRPRRSLS